MYIIGKEVSKAFLHESEVMRGMQRPRLPIDERTAFALRFIKTAIMFLLSCTIIYFTAHVLTMPVAGEERNFEEDDDKSTAVELVIPTILTDRAENGIPKKPIITVLVNDGGTVTEYRTSAATVMQLFEDVGITVSENDEVVPLATAPVADGMTVMITRVTYMYETVTTYVKHDTVVREVDTVEKGKTVTVQQGHDGVFADTYRTRVVNGVPTEDRELVYSDVISKPVKCIKEKGVGGRFTAPDGTVYEYSYRLEVIATAYYDFAKRGMTATGHAAVPGVVAVDKDVIPLHSKIYALGSVGDFNVLQCEDVGNFRGNRIDIFFNTIEECYRFGRRKMDVYVLEVNTCGTRVHDKKLTADLDYPGAVWYD